MPDILRFGIPSLDRLIGTPNKGHGFNLVAKEKQSGGRKEGSTGVCIIGPDGTGKSVFALHLASQYLADCLVDRSLNSRRTIPQILYVSTDINYDKAVLSWEHFALDLPFDRRTPFEKVSYKKGFERERFNDRRIRLKQYTPLTVVDYLSAASKPDDGDQEVCFIDLAESTAGDDWGFLHRLLALLQKPSEGGAAHLVIVDAVEGFETSAGQLDAYGESSSRRARIAQLARLTVGKAHMVVVVEEMRSGERLPEEFVSDIVIRLRNVEANKYLRRTIEVEKTRGQSHVRGQHPFSIREGKGSTTGSQENVDDPVISPLDVTGKDYPYQDYVQIFPSLSYLNRAIMAQPHAPKPALPDKQFAAFGIRYLDNMLGGDGFEAKPEEKDQQYYDTRGLPCGTVTALIGDSLTQKTRLGRWFLSRAFFPFTNGGEEPGRSLSRVVNALTSDRTFKEKLELIRDLQAERALLQPLSEQSERQEVFTKLVNEHRKLTQLKQDIAKHPAARRLLKRCGVSLLFTTLDTHHEALVKEFLDMLAPKGTDDPWTRLVAQVLIESRTICRRMEIHDVPASTFAHIFQENIKRAKRVLSSDDRTAEAIQPSRIRVVFDDFSSFRHTYHEVSEDPLFLPYLLFFLGREGVTGLIVDTQSISKPDLALTERYESELRELVQYRLYTWRVPFYGENRVAITAIPPFSPGTSGAIRELRWEGREDADVLAVSPHFELYTGLEEGKLQPVPIEIRFYAENDAFSRYLESEEARFTELFLPYKREGQTEKPLVLFRYGPEDYNRMRDFCGLQRGTRLDHALVFQVDEFWTLRPPKPGRSGAFRPQWNYLTAPTWERGTGRGRDSIGDPYGVFQPTGAPKKKEPKELRRLDFYDEQAIPYIKPYIKAYKVQDPKVNLQTFVDDRVPFSWDFGFLLCKDNAWRDAEKEKMPRGGSVEEETLIKRLHHGRSEITVNNVWRRLTKAGNGKKNKPVVSWYEFLAAGKRVAEHQSYKNPSVARTFDFSVFSPESFPCLLLEIWASEIWKDNPSRHKEMVQLTERLPTFAPTGPSLLNWLAPTPDDRKKSLSNYVRDRTGTNHHAGGYSLELYKSWLLLIEVIDFAELFPNLSAFSLELKPRQVSTSVVAARHWYKTACQFNESISEQELEANWIPVRLPGHFSVRGDWFLTVAGGSRSSRLADRALDLLSSKRANIARLQEGIGLPVRRVTSTNPDESQLRTRLVTSDGLRLRALPYKQFLAIAQTGPERDFYWLWRSSFTGFNSSLRIWHRWLSQMVIWWRSKKLKYASSWTSGFEVYARLENFGSSPSQKHSETLLERLEELDTWREFHDRIADLIDSLQEVNVDPD